MTDPTPTKPRKRPGPKPRKGDHAALALRDIYQQADSRGRAAARFILSGHSTPTELREIAECLDDLDAASRQTALDLFDTVDNRERAARPGTFSPPDLPPHWIDPETRVRPNGAAQ